MKKTKNAFMLLMLLFAAVSFTACGGDDEVGDNSGGNKSGLVKVLMENKWIFRNVDEVTVSDNGDRAWYNVETNTLYFKTSDYGIDYFVQKQYDTEGNGRRTEYDLFDYKVSGNTVTLEYENGRISKLTYKNGILTDGSFTYIPSPMSSSDYSFANSLGPKTGKCGDNLTYKYDERYFSLVISGTGRMYDYTEDNQPWHDWYIEDFEIQEGCTYIGANAFNIGYNFVINRIQLPNTLTEIGERAFAKLEIPTSIDIPDNVVKIDNEAFVGCSNCKKVLFGTNSKLEYVGDYAFDGCLSPGGKYADPRNVGKYLYHSFQLPPNLKHIGDFAFSTQVIGTLELNDKLEYIGNYAFVGTKMTAIEIPNSVKTIKSMAFGVSDFNTIVLGTGLREISPNALSGATSGSLYVNLGVPLDVEDNSYGITSNDAKWTLYVPKGSKYAYKKKEPWSKFKAIEESDQLVSGNGEPEALDPSEIDEPSKASGSIQGHEYVDLGLSVKWATCNIGANSPEEYGLFFAWGETTGYTAETHEFTRDNYMWYNDATYNTSIFNNNTLSSSYDAAYVNWGTSWRMPTRTEFEQLLNKCTWTSTMQNGVSGFLVKGPNGNSIFLPEGGRHKQTLEYEGTCGDYWTSTYYLANKTGDRAYHVFSFSSSTNRDSGVTYRYYGLNIRPVTK